MKNKLMVLGKIFSEAVKFGYRYAVAEGKVFNKIYGSNPGQGAARGARHGLAAGGAIGSLITGSDNLENGGSLQKDVNGNKASSQNKARGGHISNTGRRNRFANKSNKFCRCSSPRKYSRSRNR